MNSLLDIKNSSKHWYRPFLQTFAFFEMNSHIWMVSKIFMSKFNNTKNWNISHKRDGFCSYTQCFEVNFKEKQILWQNIIYFAVIILWTKPISLVLNPKNTEETLFGMQCFSLAELVFISARIVSFGNSNSISILLIACNRYR